MFFSLIYKKNTSGVSLKEDFMYTFSSAVLHLQRWNFYWTFGIFFANSLRFSSFYKSEANIGADKLESVISISDWVFLYAFFIRNQGTDVLLKISYNNELFLFSFPFSSVLFEENCKILKRKIKFNLNVRHLKHLIITRQIFM